MDENRKEGAEMFCGDCGKKLEDNARFCGNCGWEVKQSMQVEEQDKREGASAGGKRSSKKKVWIGVVACAALVIAGVIFFLGREDENGKSAQNEENETRIEKESEEKSEEKESSRYDKTYMFEGEYEDVVNSIKGIGHVIKDEEELTGDFNKDGKEETISYYIDGQKAYIVYNGTVAYEYDNGRKYVDYLIVLPVGNRMTGFLLTGYEEKTKRQFTDIVCFYDGEYSSRLETGKVGSVEEGIFHVKVDKSMYYEGNTDFEIVFEGGTVKYHFFINDGINRW